MRTVYETGSDKKLITVDVYGETPDGKPINSEVAKPTSDTQKNPELFIPKTVQDLYDKTLGQSDRPYEKAYAEIKKIVKNPDEFKKSLTKDMAEKVFHAVGYTGTVDSVLTPIKFPRNKKDLLANLSEKNDFFKIFVKEDLPESEPVHVGVDVRDGMGVTDVYEVNEQYSQRVNTLTNVAGQLSGDERTLDVENGNARLSFIKSYVDEAMELRLPKVVDQLISSIDSTEDQRKLKLYSVINAATHGLIDFIYTQVNDVTIGAGAIMAINPNLVEVILTNYSLGEDRPNIAKAKYLVDLLMKLDANWMTYVRGSDSIIAIDALYNATYDAIRLLIKDERTEYVAILAKDKITNDAIVQTLSMRPYTPATILTMI